MLTLRHSKNKPNCETDVVDEFGWRHPGDDEEVSDDDPQVFRPAIAEGSPQLLDLFRVIVAKLNYRGKSNCNIETSKTIIRKGCVKEDNRICPRNTPSKTSASGLACLLSQSRASKAKL